MQRTFKGGLRSNVLLGELEVGVHLVEEEEDAHLIARGRHFILLLGVHHLHVAWYQSYQKMIT